MNGECTKNSTPSVAKRKTVHNLARIDEAVVTRLGHASGVRMSSIFLRPREDLDALAQLQAVPSFLAEQIELILLLLLCGRLDQHSGGHPQLVCLDTAVALVLREGPIARRNC